MSPMIPDCGVLTTPRRCPPVKLDNRELVSSPTVGAVPYKSPPRSSEEVGVTLSSGFTFSFYKSPKLPVTPVRKVEPQPVVSRKNRHRSDGMNKGVSHKIKKPKPKTKQQIKKTRDMKTVLKRLKDGNFTPSPWLPSNRSPLKKKTPSSDGPKKRHVLSSPGMSLLENELTEEQLDDEDNNGKKFFTSRSRAAATVSIGKNVMLAAKNGDITLKQREGVFEKKNVGRIVEEQLDLLVKQSNISQSLPTPPALPSVTANPRPMPTRVLGTPSPPKRFPSPRKVKKLFTPIILDTKNSSELRNGEISFSYGEPSNGSAPAEKKKDEIVPLRRSPRKEKDALTPVKRSHLNQDRLSSPIRKSPRKCNSPVRTPSRQTGARSPARTPSRQAVTRSPARRTPRKLSPRKISPTKNSQSPRTSSLAKKAEKTSQSFAIDSSMNGNISGIVPLANELPKENGGSAGSSKMFPVFDRQRWRADKPSSPKVEKSSYPNTSCKSKSSSSQMIIDAGQKDFGARQCLECGIFYEVANPEDEASHKAYHNAINSSLKFLGWKNEKLVRDLDELGGRIVMVSSSDPQLFWRKVEEVLRIVDEELGFSDSSIRVKENTWAFLYILNKKIVGCLIAERINKANKVIPSLSPKSKGQNRLLCCSEEQTKVWAGVSRLWVLSSDRGKGIASKLVDTMRCHVLSNYILHKDDIAFSDPTENGAKFAEKYCGRGDFLVYRR